MSLNESHWVSIRGGTEPRFSVSSRAKFFRAKSEPSFFRARNSRAEPSLAISEPSPSRATSQNFLKFPTNFRIISKFFSNFWHFHKIFLFSTNFGLRIAHISNKTGILIYSRRQNCLYLSKIWLVCGSRANEPAGFEPSRATSQMSPSLVRAELFPSFFLL